MYGRKYVLPALHPLYKYQQGIAYDAVTGYANQLIINDLGMILFDSDYFPFFFAMCETMEQTIIPITNGIAKSSPTSQGALLPGAYRRTVQL